MTEPENVVELEDVTTSKTEFLIPIRVKEETSTTTQGEMSQISMNPNGGTNPKPKTPSKHDEVKVQQ
jgi:hypothetical protein